MKDYYWCGTHRVGHRIDEPRCPMWEAAMRENEIRNERRHTNWKRATNRGLRYRRCVFCRQLFDAGAVRGKGRPREVCSETCSKGRETEVQRLRRHGVSTPAVTGSKNRPKGAWGWGNRVRYANGHNGYRVSPELRDFMDAFPDGGWTITDQP